MAASPVPEERFQTGRVAAIAGAHAVHDTYSAYLPPLLPVFVERLALARAEAGALTLCLQAPSLLQPIFGHVGDHVDVRVLVVVAPAITAAAMSLLGLAGSYGSLVALLLVAGLSSASLHATAPVLAGRLSGSRLGKGMGFWMVGGELGRALGPVVVVSALALLGPRGTAWLMTVGIGVSLLLGASLRSVHVEPVEGERTAWWRAMVELRPLLGPLTGFVLSRSFAMAAITTYLPLYLHERGASVWLAGAALSILEAAGVLGALVVGSLSDSVGRRRLLVLSLAITPLLMVAFAVSTRWLQVVLLAGLGFAGVAVTPVVMAVAQEACPERRALANGVYMALSFGVRGGIIVLVGAIADAIGMSSTFLACAALTPLGIPFALRLPSRPS